MVMFLVCKSYTGTMQGVHTRRLNDIPVMATVVVVERRSFISVVTAVLVNRVAGGFERGDCPRLPRRELGVYLLDDRLTRVAFWLLKWS